jgi:hypothetical protein
MRTKRKDNPAYGDKYHIVYKVEAGAKEMIGQDVDNGQIDHV